GPNQTGATWYERGYNPANLTSGIPAAGSLVTNAGGNHVFRMPADYHINNVVFLGHQNGNRTTISGPATLTISNPGAFTSLSFLTSAGGAGATPIQIGYTIHYSDETTEAGTFGSPDWFNGAVNIFNAAGRVTTAGGFQNVGGNPAGAVFGADIFLGNPVANVTSIDLYFAGAGSPANLYNNGRAVVFAVSGAKDNSID